MPLVYSNNGLSCRNVDSDHVLEDGEVFSTRGLDHMTDEELSAVFPGYGETIAKREAQRETIEKIRELEASVTQRRIREAVTGKDDGWLRALDDQISTLRKSLQG